MSDVQNQVCEEGPFLKPRKTTTQIRSSIVGKVNSRSNSRTKPRSVNSKNFSFCMPPVQPADKNYKMEKKSVKKLPVSSRKEIQSCKHSTVIARTRELPPTRQHHAANRSDSSDDDTKSAKSRRRSIFRPRNAVNKIKTYSRDLTKTYF